VVLLSCKGEGRESGTSGRAGPRGWPATDRIFAVDASSNGDPHGCRPSVERCARTQCDPDVDQMSRKGGKLKRDHAVRVQARGGARWYGVCALRFVWPDTRSGAHRLRCQPGLMAVRDGPTTRRARSENQQRADGWDVEAGPLCGGREILPAPAAGGTRCEPPRSSRDLPKAGPALTDRLVEAG